VTEGRRSERSSSPDALDMVARARAYLYRGVSRENFAAAVQLYQEALQLAGDDVRALAELADVLAGNVSSLWSKAPREDLRQAGGWGRERWRLIQMMHIATTSSGSCVCCNVDSMKR
jgi:hypothetical protein